MRDEMNTNTMTVTGTPSLVTGALTVDPDQALSFSGPTSFASAADSTSLSITGSLSIELFLWLDSLPGATRDIVRKTSSYAVQVNSSGRVLFVLTNGASNITLTSNVSLSTGRWYHLVCVYNGNYAGLQVFGNATLTDQLQVDDDNGNNKAVTTFPLPEPALLQAVNIALQYRDEIWPVQMCAVVYSKTDSLPDALVTSSPVQTLNPPTPQWRNWTWVTFPLTPILVPAGSYYLGYVADTVAGIPKAPLVVGKTGASSQTVKRPDSVTGPSNPFGAANSETTDEMSMYASYTATSRTGHEGKALIYIDGALNVSAAYTAGIADNTNALEVTPAVAARVDELSIWNKALTGVQIATHYTAH